MYAISLWQPWATLFCTIDPATGRAPKEYETRSWAAQQLLGKRVVIHAAKRWVNGTTQMINRADLLFHQTLIRCRYRTGDPRYPDNHFSIPAMPALPLGALIGVVTICQLIETHVMRDRLDASPERQFGDWSTGRWAWRACAVTPFPKPIPWKGARGIFHVPDAVVRDGLSGTP